MGKLKQSRYSKSILIFLIILLHCQVWGQEKQIIGCYRHWDWKKDPETFAPQNIPYDKLTIINYCFFYPLENGEVAAMDSTADRFLLRGENNSGESIISIAKTHGTKVLLSIGGWETSYNFPQVSADPVKRANFAHWCIKHIQQYGFNGIDIDWEFPGYKPHKGTGQDRENFNVLLKTVHDSLQALTAVTGKQYLLSVSLPAAASHLPDIDLQKISSIADFINIMTYDLFGPWGNISNHNSALYGPAKGDSARSLDGAFKLYHDIHNVPADKINLCAAFFGYAYAGCTDIYGGHSGADTTAFKPGRDIYYSDIYERMDEFEHRWDAKAQAPYLVDVKNKILVSFEDEQSAALKAEYIKKSNGAGIIIWPLMGDYLDNGETPLLDAIYKTFR